MIEILIRNPITKYAISIFFVFVLFFSRSFMGIYIFGYRVGEYTMVFSLLFYILSLALYKQIDKKFILGQEFFIVNLLIFLFFVINVFISNSSFLNPYTYKVSSYIWPIGFFFLGLHFFNQYRVNLKYLIVLLIGLIYLYFFSIFGLPSSVVEFIRSISDKFEPHKGSDLLIMFSSTFFIFNRYMENKRTALEVFSLFTFLYLPLLLFKSRGAFIGFLIFVLFEFLYLRKSLKASAKRNFILFFLTLFILLQSIFLINGSSFIKLQETDENIRYITEYRADPDDEKFRLLFFEEDYWTKEMRIKSTDNNLNWRLQIWQDVYFDIHYNNLYLTGYGYKNKIPAMEIETRQGLDKLNEHVHNYLVTIYARGGLVHLLLFGFLYFYLIRILKLRIKTIHFLPLLAALLFASFFDVAMENSHYPLIFYFMFGFIVNRKNQIKYI